MPTDELVRRYLLAKRIVVEAGHAPEIAWQASAGKYDLDAATFLREAAWVVLSAGMSESVVRRRFPALTEALFDFNPVEITLRSELARTAALSEFGHKGKIESIISIAAVAAELGAACIQAKLRSDAEDFLRALPYIGPTTWRHLAKNLGVPVAKADRHLVRIAAAAGREDVDSLCDEISIWLGEPIPVIDVVLWRWAVIHAGACPDLCDGLPHTWRHESRVTLTGVSSFAMPSEPTPV